MRTSVGVYASYQVLKQEELLIWVVHEKNTHVVVNFCAQKSVGMQFHKKFFINLVKDLFKCNEG